MMPAVCSSRFAAACLMGAVLGGPPLQPVLAAAPQQAAAAALSPSVPSTPDAPDPAVPAPSLTTDAEREVFLRKARVIRTRGADKGVTNTLRVTLSDGVHTHDASVQTIDVAKTIFEGTQGVEMNFKDSWRFNLAAYHVDRLLGLRMVPVTVERRHKSATGSFTWWVDDVLMDEQERYQNGHEAPVSEEWNQQMWTTRLFDQLIANVDRNLGNLLIDTRWRIWMIDHSRAFRIGKTLRAPGNLSKVERTLLDRLRQLDRAGLRKSAGRYLTGGEIDALLARRDLIVEHFERAGEAMIFERKPR